jgi:hypothetical protein
MTGRLAGIKPDARRSQLRTLARRKSEHRRSVTQSAKNHGRTGMAGKKVVVAGATGLVGNAALRHFGTSAPCEVIALSRRKPRDLYGARHVPIDLTSEADCRRAAADLEGATHLIYAALYEAPQLVDGWRGPQQIKTNDLMLRNLMGVLEPVAPDLRHVALLQGTKAYGVHVRP